MVERAAIIPTGDEILKGTVIDTDSPAVMGLILESFPSCEVTRFRPLLDDEKDIIGKLRECIESSYDLIIFIGGSGGGHRCVPSLGKDYTHSALVRYLPDAEHKEIYGKNGHLWSKLIAARQSNSMIITLPGPHAEAVEAARAAITAIKNDEKELKVLIDKMIHAVLNQYSSGCGIE